MNDIWWPGKTLRLKVRRIKVVPNYMQLKRINKKILFKISQKQIKVGQNEKNQCVSKLHNLLDN